MIEILFKPITSQWGNFPFGILPVILMVMAILIGLYVKYLEKKIKLFLLNEKHIVIPQDDKLDLANYLGDQHSSIKQLRLLRVLYKIFWVLIILTASLGSVIR
jgi:hypothetical protein